MSSIEWLRTLLEVSSQRRKKDEAYNAPPSKLYDVPALPNRTEKIHKRKADASVALILRVVDRSGVLENQYFDHGTALLHSMSDECELELLYMKRTSNENDPWSGHVAFPGGRQDPNETLFGTAVRETNEEVGLSLEKPYFEYLTYLEPESITRMQKKSGAHVYPFVFLQLWIPQEHSENEVPECVRIERQSSEVAAAIWVPLRHFRLPPDRSIVRRRAEYLPGLQQLPRLFRLILGVTEAWFPSICFPHSGQLRADGTLEFLHTSQKTRDTSGSRPVFNLWGISLAITDDLCKLLRVNSCRTLNWPPLLFNSYAVLPNGFLRACYGLAEIGKYPQLKLHPCNILLAVGVCGGVLGLVSLPVFRRIALQQRGPTT
eukprot:gb/GECG01009727.1/.p1 GENE.gb/GECG01009727.1/~~gb/GECG01009727.1/.p1  ORF type:complete len:375 (+),score=34.91 gb/GECG01009727.1/:1-1125(+)